MSPDPIFYPKISKRCSVSVSLYQKPSYTILDLDLIPCFYEPSEKLSYQLVVECDEY